MRGEGAEDPKHTYCVCRNREERTGVLTEARQRERRAVGVEVGTARRCVVCVVPGRRWAGPPEQKVGKECLGKELREKQK